MKTGYVISDLHLFSRRSCADKYMPDIYRLVENAELLVLNGDIVDFRWSVFSSVDATIQKTLQWLHDLCSHAPQCMVFYIMGNHDGTKRFSESLEQFRRDHHNFKWSASHLHIDDKLFFHGDGALFRNSSQLFKRHLKHERIITNRIPHVVYSMMIALRLHNIQTSTNSRRRNAKLIENDLKKYSSDMLRSVSTVYYGHTHAASSDFTYNGITYFNSGCAIRHLRFMPHRFSFHTLP
jgi:UDP-2,3-diacylglucosamine hydrolase